MKKGLLVLIGLLCLVTNGAWASSTLQIEPHLSFEIGAGMPGSFEWDWTGTVQANWLDFHMNIGKERLVWGRGQTGTLSLSPSSPAIPLMNYEFRIPEGWYLNQSKWLPSLQYVRFMSPLELDQERWLFGHRLQADLGSRLQVGGWEMMMCSDKIFPGYYVPVPLFPLYAMQHLAYKLTERVYDYNSNAFLGFDFSYRWSEDREFYGELAVDDFPQWVTEPNPKKAGGLIGFKWESQPGTTWWTEYVRINNFVYTHRNPSNRYMYDDQPFGHWLGMDGDLLAVGVNHQFNPQDQLTVQFHSIRRGEGDYQDNWQAEFGTQMEFLTGVVESSHQLYLAGKRSLNPQLEIDSALTVGRRVNADHQLEKTEFYYQFQIGLGYDLF